MCERLLTAYLVKNVCSLNSALSQWQCPNKLVGVMVMLLFFSSSLFPLFSRPPTSLEFPSRPHWFKLLSMPGICHHYSHLTYILSTYNFYFSQCLLHICLPLDNFFIFYFLSFFFFLDNFFLENNSRLFQESATTIDGISQFSRSVVSNSL